MEVKRDPNGDIHLHISITNNNTNTNSNVNDNANDNANVNDNASSDANNRQESHFISNLFEAAAIAIATAAVSMWF